MEGTTSSLLYSCDLPSVSRRSYRPFTDLPYTPNFTRRFISSRVRSSARYAILGAGFAGLSVAWHLLQHSSKESSMSIDIYDESGLGGGASGVSGGLLHPYSPKGKLLWRGSESWKECLELLVAAERAVELSYSSWTSHDQSYSFDGPIILRRGILKPATAETKVEILKANAQNCLTSCPLELLDGQAATCLVPNLSVPLDFAIYMPFAMNIHPKRYLQALFLACKIFATEVSSSPRAVTEISLLKKHVNSLRELDGEYDAVIICLGAEAGKLPELSGNLPLRNCRGIIAELQLPTDVREYSNQSPSILSNAWLAFQGPRNVLMGSTWEWKSNNYSSHVTSEEAAEAINELLPKVSVVYPAIKKWEFVGARAGLRAMPPLTPLGSLPLLGCVAGDGNCQYWLVGGLGSRGLLYHGLLGKLMAQAVVSSDEALLPFELTSWKSKSIQN
ncbi:hypothetical protein KFK09_011913 [Dendrobium nobile]|uniref:FAD dependent oxidoreductase domain-containing protein n=1 Tax=Dendrobium nobile TaxID=94219 RepID=A0A8T3BJI5_DENNO|nr:hypothetical protein KFK09_011913 [Dendrobium nobile]